MLPADGRNVAFGQVVSGLDVLEDVSNLFHMDGKPLQPVTVVDCGLVE